MVLVFPKESVLLCQNTVIVSRPYTHTSR